MANFDSIQSIGILSNPRNLAEINELEKVIKHFAGHNKLIVPLLYFDKPIENKVFRVDNVWSILEMENLQKNAIPKQNQDLDQNANVLVNAINELSFSSSITKNQHWIQLAKENCNWIGKPRLIPTINLFISKEFDILIDLSYSKNYSLQSIFIQSKAHLKIMNTSDLSNHFADLTLKTSDPQDKFAFTIELIHYLEIINKNQL